MSDRPAVTVIGTNIVIDFGDHEQAITAMDRLAATGSLLPVSVAPSPDQVIDGSAFHTPGFDCWCEPSREWIEDGGTIVLHHQPATPAEPRCDWPDGECSREL